MKSIQINEKLSWLLSLHLNPEQNVVVLLLQKKCQGKQCFAWGGENKHIS